MATYKEIYYPDATTNVNHAQISLDKITSVDQQMYWTGKGIPQHVANTDALAPLLEPPPGVVIINADGTAAWVEDVGSEYRYSLNGVTAGWHSANTGLMIVPPDDVVFGGGAIVTSGTYVDDSGRVNFSNVTDIYVNGIFSPAFKNYRFLFTDGWTSAPHTSINMQFTADGVGDSSANYCKTTMLSNSATITGTQVTNGTAFEIESYASASGRFGFSSFNIYNAHLPKPSVDIIATKIPAGGGAPTVYAQNGYFDSTTKIFDGVRIFIDGTITMSGCLIIFGYN